MNLTLRRTGTLRAFLVVFLSISLIGGFVVAEEMTDFEKLLREAIQSNQESKAAETSSEKSVPGKLVPSQKDAKTTETPPKKLAARPMPLETVKTKKNSIDDGWTTVMPNTQNEKKGLDPILVADTTMPEAAKTESGVSVWDAVPETVSPGVEEKSGKPTLTTLEETEKKEEKAPKSPWDTVENEDVAKAPLDWNAAVESEAQPSVLPWNVSMKATTEDASAVKVEDEKQPVAEEAPSGEAKEPTPEEAKPEPKQEENTEPQKSVEETSAGEMSSILNALENEGKKSDNAPKALKEEPEKKATEDAETDADEKETKTAGKTPEEASESVTEDVKLKQTVPPMDEESEKEKTEKSEDAPDRIVVDKLPEPSFPDFDGDDDETAWKLVDGSRVGDPYAKEKIKLLYDEIVNGLKARNVTGRYEMWKNYAKSTLRNTAGLNTGSELDGRCRLNWYKNLFADPIKSVFEVEEFSRNIHHGLAGSHRHISETMGIIRDKMDIPARNDEGVRFIECKTPFDAVNEVKRCLLEAQMAHARAISTLTVAEQVELDKSLVPTFVGPGCVNGHTIPNRSFGRRLTNILEKIDKAAMYDAAEALLPLTNPSLLALLDKLPEDAFPTSMAHGHKVQRISTAAGDIVIGGRESNTYDLDAPEMRDVVCVIDLGGNDTYRDGTCNLQRPVLAIIDLHGNDNYVGTKPGIQGGSLLGVSILVDAEGDDTYSAGDIAQGSSIGGAGMLFDFSGNDTYKALRRCQGHALCGLGMLIDRKGHDKYRAALWAQGFGAPGGFGVLEDCEGNDHYYCGGIYLDSYPEHPGYDGWGQGIGAGLRQVGNGGIGMILDGAGDDNYEVDYFGHGGGYWLGIGVARDFGGNDIRHGTTLSGYNGGPRQQTKWTRFANGFGCHYALGYLFDDAGNDVYGGTIMGTGMAWDLSIGYLCDFNGSDRFTATGGMTQGVGAEGSIGILFSYGGDDTYMGRNQAYASSGITYHSPSNCGGNISFLINYGGDDKYGCGAKNNSYVQRGSPSGFLIDRPTDREAADELTKLNEMIKQREKEIAEYDEMIKKAREEAAEKGRRYVPRQRRPLPISADQLQRLGSVPHFEPTPRTGGNGINVK